MNPMNPGGYPPGGQPPQGYGPPGQQGHGQPPQNYGQPPQNYGQPPQNYGQPPQNYGQPPQNYGQPPQNYGPPGAPPAYGAPGQPMPGGYGMPGAGSPGGMMPGMPPAGMAMMGGAPAGNPYGQAQSALKNAGGMLKVMRIAFLLLGVLMALGGVALLFTVGAGAGIGLMISGVVMAGVGWFTLPMFMGMVGGATSMVDGLAAKQQLLSTGMPATARILGLQQTGTFVNMNPQVLLMLEVQGPQGPYQVQTMAVIPQMSIPQCQPGAVVQVRINPANPQDVAVAV